MSTITSTTRIRSEKDVTDKTDLSQYSPCKHCGQKPRITEITWGGRRNKGLLAKCCDFDGWLDNWNRFNKVDLCPHCGGNCSSAKECRQSLYSI